VAYLLAGLRREAEAPAPAPRTTRELVAALDALHAERGDAGLFRVGLAAAGHTAHAFHFYLLNTSDPAQAFARVEDIQHRVHPRRAIRVVSVTDRGVEIEHCAADGGPAPRSGSLFGTGLAVGLVQLLGCDGITLTLPAEEGHVLYDARGFHPPALRQGVHRWRIAWDRFVPRQILPAMDGWLRAQLPPPLDDVVGQVRHRVAQAPGRPWTVARMGDALGRSPRALQRALRAAGTTFSGVLWEARTVVAETLLREGRSLTEVAAAAGFADASHLSRRLRRGL
jgi:AraC-like DNA-binding protein